MVAPGHQLASLIERPGRERTATSTPRCRCRRRHRGEVRLGDFPGWSKSVFSWWRRIRKQPWLAPDPVPKRSGPGKARIALLADWGTGLYGAVQSARPSKRTDASTWSCTLATSTTRGTRKEVRENFLARWPKVPGAISRALNSNHEMYCGGDGLFNETLPAFKPGRHDVRPADRRLAARRARFGL